jgi:hypothetical protein
MYMLTFAVFHPSCNELQESWSTNGKAASDLTSKSFCITALIGNRPSAPGWRVEIPASLSFFISSHILRSPARFLGICAGDHQTLRSPSDSETNIKWIPCYRHCASQGLLLGQMDNVEIQRTMLSLSIQAKFRERWQHVDRCRPMPLVAACRCRLWRLRWKQLPRTAFCDRAGITFRWAYKYRQVQTLYFLHLVIPKESSARNAC